MATGGDPNTTQAKWGSLEIVLFLPFSRLAGIRELERVDKRQFTTLTIKTCQVNSFL